MAEFVGLLATMLGSVVLASVGLATLILRGQRGLGQHIDRLDQRIDRLDQRIDRLDQRIDRLDQRMGMMETRMGVMETRMGVMETHIAEIDQRLRAVEHNQAELTGFLQGTALRVQLEPLSSESTASQ